MSGFILVLDGAVFRRSLPPDYLAFYTAPLLPRTPLLCLMAAGEEVRFRLVLMTALLAAAAALLRRAPPAGCVVLAIVGAQGCNVGALVLHAPVYASLRYLAVGSVWGWLYWRHGWVSALAGHAATHLILDPLLLAALS